MAGTRNKADIVVVQVEEMDKTLTKTVPDPEKTYCKEVQVGKAVELECYICQKLFPKHVEVKGHIRKVHYKKEADETQRKKKNRPTFPKRMRKVRKGRDLKMRKVVSELSPVWKMSRILEFFWEHIICEHNQFKFYVPVNVVIRKLVGGIEKTQALVGF